MNRWYLLVLWIVLLGCASSSQNEAEAQTVYVTRTGAKYHRESCQYLRSSKIPMKLNEAKKYYTACSVCAPPKTAGDDEEVTEEEENPETEFSHTTDTVIRSRPAPAPSRTVTRSAQCSGTTKAGLRCKRMTNDPSGKCWQHQ